METIQTESRSIIDDIDNAMERNVSLNGMSHRDIERTVMQVVAETIQSYGIAAEPITAVIYGSRTREDYHATSDLDVLVEYQGDIREDALFNLLHEQDISIGGMEVDVNPIRSEQSGSAAEYLARIARLQEKDRKEMTV
jgi:predicted nucleotidyltransferase